MSFHTGQSFTFGETPSATKWNYLWENDYALQDWSAFDNDSLPVDDLIKDGDIGPEKLDSDATGHGMLEIGRAIAGSTVSSLSIPTIAARRQLKILVTTISVGNTSVVLRFNNDSGNNYCRSQSAGSSATLSDITSTDGMPVTTSQASGVFDYQTIEMVNISSREKQGRGTRTLGNTAGAANVPTLVDYSFKWANTSDQVTRIDMIATAGQIAAGSGLIVLANN